MSVTHRHPTSDSPSDHRGLGHFSIEAADGADAISVRVSGELDAASAPGLGDRLEELSSTGRDVHLDLGQTSFIDSAGIRVLVRSVWAAQQAGSTMTLVATSPAAENILRITGILDILKDPNP